MTTSLDYHLLISQVMRGQVEPVERSPVDVRVLDAALVLLGEFGEKRLTVDDVASKAKVGRRTVFRRFGSKDALLAEVYQREVLKATAQVAQAADNSDGPLEALSAGYCQLADVAINHPVIRRLARVEPEVLVGLWRSGSPSGFEIFQAILQSLIDQHEWQEAQLAAMGEGSDILCRLLFADELLMATPQSLEGRRDTVRRILQGLTAADPTH